MTTYFYFHSPLPKLQLRHTRHTRHTAPTTPLYPETDTFHLDVMIQKRSANTSDSYNAKIPPNLHDDGMTSGGENSLRHWDSTQQVPTGNKNQTEAYLGLTTFAFIIAASSTNPAAKTANIRLTENHKNRNAPIPGIDPANGACHDEGNSNKPSV